MVLMLQSTITLRSYVDERFQLERTLWAAVCAWGFRACFGPRRALWASMREEFRAAGFNEGIGIPCLLGSSTLLGALTRALGFHVRFGGCHQHRLVGAARASLALATGGCIWTGRGWATSRSRRALAALRYAVNKSCYRLVYCSYSPACFYRHRTLQRGIGPVR